MQRYTEVNKQRTSSIHNKRLIPQIWTALCKFTSSSNTTTSAKALPYLRSLIFQSLSRPIECSKHHCFLALGNQERLLQECKW